jgi:hypothetical protein
MDDGSFPERLRFAIAELRAQVGADWPLVDERAGPRGPIWRLVQAFGPVPLGSADHHRLAWLTLHASRRSLIHWELASDGTEPHEALHAVRTWLGHRKVPHSWDALSTPFEPHGLDASGAKVQDARYAGRSVAHLARFVRRADPVDAFNAIAYADQSFELSPPDVREHFRLWMLDVAVPAGLAERDLNPSEAKAVRSHDSGTIRRRTAPR